MGKVEICINEDGTLRVVQRYDLRAVLRHVRPESLERHRVSSEPSCSCSPANVPTAEFNRVLKILFIITLSMGALTLLLVEQYITDHRGFTDLSTWDYIFNQTWLFGHFGMGPNGVVLLVMFAAILTAGVLWNNVKKKTGSAPARGEEVQTVSARVQQV